jgi:phosphate transport system substrate-binding protein
MNLIEHKTNMILVAREPSEDELLSAGLGAVTLDVQPVALDAFVFLVHADNPIESLSIQEIQSIYTGETTNWAELGNPEGEIHPYLRNPNSGSQELMENLVMQGATMIDAPDMILESMMGPFNAISTDPQGIGYSVYYYAQNIFPNEAVQMIAVDGIYPSSETIAEGEYPLATEVYVVIRADTPVDSPARQLRDWLLTEAGQAVVAASGYVPLNSSTFQTEGF